MKDNPYSKFTPAQIKQELVDIYSFFPPEPDDIVAASPERMPRVHQEINAMEARRGRSATFASLRRRFGLILASKQNTTTRSFRSFLGESFEEDFKTGINPERPIRGYLAFYLGFDFIDAHSIADPNIILTLEQRGYRRILEDISFKQKLIKSQRQLDSFFLKYGTRASQFTDAAAKLEQDVRRLNHMQRQAFLWNEELAQATAGRLKVSNF